MKLPNPLDSRIGRIGAFFFLYVSEGIPLGFTATAIATQMRREGVSAGDISIFVGMLYFPWAWKWVMGPVVDLVWSEKFGRRRGWIVAMQGLMIVTMLLGMGINFSVQLQLFTGLMLLLNCFSATQDIAIDALACSVLSEKERGVANGFMFAGAHIGQAVGGAVVLLLIANGFFTLTGAFVFVAGCLLAVTLGISIWLKEPKTEPEKEPDGLEREGPEQGRLERIGAELATYVVTAFRAFFGTRYARAGLVFAVLPTGAMALHMALASNLQVELGMSDSQIGWFTIVCIIIAAAAAVTGGLLSDLIGRRKMLAVYVIGMAIPALLLAWQMYHYQWIMPVSMKMENRPPVPEMLLIAFIVLSLVFNLFSGLMHGTRTALFMDICTKEVAATQFTAYMSMINLVTWYTGIWQGLSIEHLGYPATLAIDAVFGTLCILVLPFTMRRDK